MSGIAILHRIISSKIGNADQAMVMVWGACKTPVIVRFIVLVALVMMGCSTYFVEANAQTLTDHDWQQILSDARLRRMGDYYLAPECDDPLQVSIEAVDLNGDGQPEVILTVFGSPCFSGLMQSNVSVYVRSSRGNWRDVLGFVPAFGVRVQPTQTKGYADLALTVLGGCDPVYRWAGASYIYASQIPAYDRDCRSSRL